VCVGGGGGDGAGRMQLCVGVVGGGKAGGEEWGRRGGVDGGEGWVRGMGGQERCRHDMLQEGWSVNTRVNSQVSAAHARALPGCEVSGYLHVLLCARVEGRLPTVSSTPPPTQLPAPRLTCAPCSR
jgi:hypothetical protein